MRGGRLFYAESTCFQSVWIFELMDMKSVCFSANAWEAEGFLGFVVAELASYEINCVDFVVDWVVEENGSCFFEFLCSGETEENAFAHFLNFFLSEFFAFAL